jgi:hypothetical protein
MYQFESLSLEEEKEYLSVIKSLSIVNNILIKKINEDIENKDNYLEKIQINSNNIFACSESIYEDMNIPNLEYKRILKELNQSSEYKIKTLEEKYINFQEIIRLCCENEKIERLPERKVKNYLTIYDLASINSTEDEDCEDYVEPNN